MLRGTSEPRLPPQVAAALGEIFGSAALQVRLVPNSWYVRLHGRSAATTRRNVIYLRGTLAQFVADPALMLHEYFHVIRQWRPRRLTKRRYLMECLRHGYWNNRFECEARDFTHAHLPRLMVLLQKKGNESGPQASAETAQRQDALYAGPGYGASAQHAFSAPLARSQHE